MITISDYFFYDHEKFLMAVTPASSSILTAPIFTISDYLYQNKSICYNDMSIFFCTKGNGMPVFFFATEATACVPWRASFISEIEFGSRVL